MKNSQKLARRLSVRAMKDQEDAMTNVNWVSHVDVSHMKICVDHFIYDDYQFPMVTKEYEIEFYAKSSYKFDQKYPVGTQTRADIEDRIIKDYFEFASSCCDYEQEWHRQRPDIPTPVCDKLQQLRKHQT
ncbi:hypothetical protein Tco_0813903 [Tanacetum coccineum]